MDDNNYDNEPYVAPVNSDEDATRVERLGTSISAGEQSKKQFDYYYKKFIEFASPNSS